jgi:hypothetical protein
VHEECSSRSRYVNPCPKKFKICPDKLVKENIEQAANCFSHQAISEALTSPAHDKDTHFTKSN